MSYVLTPRTPALLRVSMTCFSGFEIKCHQRITVRPWLVDCLYFQSVLPVCTLSNLQVVPVE